MSVCHAPPAFHGPSTLNHPRTTGWFPYGVNQTLEKDNTLREQQDGSYGMCLEKRFHTTRRRRSNVSPRCSKRSKRCHNGFGASFHFDTWSIPTSKGTTYYRMRPIVFLVLLTRRVVCSVQDASSLSSRISAFSLLSQRVLVVRSIRNE